MSEKIIGGKPEGFNARSRNVSLKVLFSFSSLSRLSVLREAFDFKFDESGRAFYVAPMSSADQVAVVIPCLNEAKEIFALVSAVRKFLPNIIVVDDGSTDETANLAARAGAEVLKNETPLGKGMALNLGFRRALERGFPFALAMDGDGQHAPKDIPKFFSSMDKAPLVIGNRMENCAPMPWLRTFVNRWMSQRLSRIAGRNLPDTQCGFRLVDLNAWAELDLQTTHFEIESELVLSFAAAGHAIEFVPIEVIYKDERSKIHPVRDTIRWFRWWRKARRQFQTVRPASDFSLVAESITRAPK